MPKKFTLRHALGMWLWNSANAKATGRRGGTSGPPPMMAPMLSGQPQWSTWNARRAVEEGYKVSTWVYACVRRRSVAAASVPWIVQEKDKEGNWQRVPGHPLEVLLRYPNPHLSGRKLLELMSINLDLAGNNVWYLNVVKGQPVEIWPLPTDRVTPVTSRNDWITSYDYRPDGQTTPIHYDPGQILHLMYVNPDNAFWGMAPLQAAAKVVDTDVEAVKWNKVSLQNRAITDGVFTFPDVLEEDQYNEAKRQVREEYQGADNSHAPWVLGGSAHWEAMARTPVEMDFIQSRRMNREEICSVFQVPPVLVGILDHATYSNYEQAVKSFWQDTMVPHLQDVSDALNMGLLPFFDEKAAQRAKGQLVEPDIRIVPDFSVVHALQDDLSQLVTTARVLFSMGVPFSEINQRLDLGIGDFDGADESWRPATLAPAGAAGADAGGNGQDGGSSGTQGDSGGQKRKFETKDDFVSFNLEGEEQKAMYWKSFENRREGWYGAVTEKMRGRFDSERKAVVSAIRGAKTMSAVDLAVSNVLTDQREPWTKLLGSVYVAVADDFGKQTMRGLRKGAAGPDSTKEKTDQNDGGSADATPEFSVWDNAVQDWLVKNAATKVVQITDTTMQRIRDHLAEGVKNGESIPDLASRIDTLYLEEIIPHRSTVIARTEVINASNLGSFAAAKQTGLDLQKEWLATPDDRTRETHSIANGQVQNLDDPFYVGGDQLMWPGDISMGASADEVINCRCTLTYVSKEGG